MIKVALPNKGQLFERTMEILSACGYRVNKNSRSLSTLDQENEVEFFFLRPSDIPLYVANGILDAGITGKDFVAEKGLSPSCLYDLNYGHSRLCAAAPAELGVTNLTELRGKRIATSFPNLVARYFPERELLVELEGAVEISVKLGIADAVVDLVETGSTLKQAGLTIVGEPLFRSQAALFGHPGREAQPELVTLRNRLEGKVLAQEYMMVEYDCPTTMLDAACAITPGIESPTVMSLAKPGWSSVKSMVLRRQAQPIMDKLARLGCRGILLTSIESVRI
ncbi:MAG TPA: ATP phosphoribosyltransferase [Polyangiaceae bacterium]|nr:ATP phosphoribosyltransferase [Polyangiaceae bacterium]